MKAYSTDNYGEFREREVYSTNEPPTGSYTVEVTDDVISSGFQGFGVAVTGSSCYLLSRMDEKKRKAILNDLYGKDGLGLSVARLTIASSDYSAELYSYEDENGQFSIKKDEAYVLPVVTEIAKSYKDVKFFASPWSPPGRMKTGGSICGGFMRDGFIGEYVDYILSFVKEYTRRGVPIWAITPQNECETDQGGRMPACYWSPETEAKFVLALRKKADEQGLPFEIWLCDHNFSLYNRVIWQLTEFPELQTAASSVAFHYYGGGVELTDHIKKKFPSFTYHFTEGGPRLYDNYETDYCKWGAIMARNLNYGCKSFTGWNLILDEAGLPNVGPFFCGGLITEHSVTKELSYSGQYKAFKHFSPFVKRGASVLRSSVLGESHGFFMYPNHVAPTIEACAVRNENGQTVLIVVNPDKKERRQMVISYKGKYYYFDALPDSVNTVILEERV